MGWTWISAGVVTIACVAGGCADRDRPEPTQLEVYSSAKLETAPLKVRTAFRDDYPGAVVHDVQTVSPRSGPLLYQITFDDAGLRRSVTYTMDGALFRTDAPPPPRGQAE